LTKAGTGGAREEKTGAGLYAKGVVDIVLFLRLTVQGRIGISNRAPGATMAPRKYGRRRVSAEDKRSDIV
jgi:hypothetical protein